MGRNSGRHRGLGRALVVCALAGGTVTALTPLAQAGTGGTEYVATTGTDSGSCRLVSHPCQTIGYALTQNTTDSTIMVAAGDYPEQITVTAPVTIDGAGAGTTVIDPSTVAANDTDPNHSTNPYPIVDVNGTNKVKLENLTVDGSAAVSQYNSCLQNPMGVYYHNASGTMTSVAVTNIQEPAGDFGCQSGLGVYVASDSGTHSVSMSKLTVTGYQKNGVTCRDAGTTCSVTNSTVTGVGPSSSIAENGIEGYGIAKITVTSDTVSANSYTGGGAGNQATGLLILDVGTVTAKTNHLSSNDINGYFGNDGGGPTPGTWTISGNTVATATSSEPLGQGYGDGIVLDSTSNAVTVTNNKVSKSAEYGIALYGASNAAVDTNSVTGSGSDGIYVGGPGSAANIATSNSINSNTVKGNHGDGINADTSSAMNTFTSNTADYNLVYDLRDAGNGTNMWTTNTCAPAHDSSPAGLC